jgi:hypothetical protein
MNDQATATDAITIKKEDIILDTIEALKTIRTNNLPIPLELETVLRAIIAYVQKETDHALS